MGEWVADLGPAEGAERLVREKKAFNIDEQVQSQHWQSPLQVLRRHAGLASQCSRERVILRSTGHRTLSRKAAV